MNGSDKVSFLNYWTEPHNFWKIFDDMLTLHARDIYIGGSASSNPELEQKIINNTASYGRQLGWILDALVIIAKKLESMDKIQLTEEEQLAFYQIYVLKAMIDKTKKNACVIMDKTK